MDTQDMANDIHAALDLVIDQRERELEELELTIRTAQRQRREVKKLLVILWNAKMERSTEYTYPASQEGQEYTPIT